MFVCLYSSCSICFDNGVISSYFPPTIFDICWRWWEKLIVVSRQYIPRLVTTRFCLIILHISSLAFSIEVLRRLVDYAIVFGCLYRAIAYTPQYFSLMFLDMKSSRRMCEVILWRWIMLRMQLQYPNH